VKKRRRSLARGAALGAPPSLVWCTATPVAVTAWRSRGAGAEAGTVSGGVHRLWCDGAPSGAPPPCSVAPSLFSREWGFWCWAPPQSPPPHGGAPPYFSREEGKQAARPEWYRHPLSGAAAACPVPQRLMTVGGSLPPPYSVAHRHVQ
jgi:hypothetical protein